MKKIYCISGLGADERVFDKLRIRNVSLQYLKWLTPEKNETIERYSSRMSVQIGDENPLLMGVSFGGMMAIEIAKKIQTQKIILISSVKSQTELPSWMRICGKLNLNVLMPPRSPKWFSPIADNYLGVETADEKILAKNFREANSPVYLQWAIDKVIKWQNTIQPSTIFHIHGTHDKTFPIKNIHPTHVIKNGGHFMVLNRAVEISAIIESILA
jgi:pimeloyl-ACP methyl ester carboxylesterase